MFNMLIYCKKTVSIRCGKDEIKGIISNYYQAFRLLKINNILIPIELIEHIEVLEPDGALPMQQQTLRDGKPLRLVHLGGHSS